MNENLSLHPVSSAAAALLFMVAPAAPAQSQLWIVDDDAGPGVQFTTIQAAIDAANDGDSILIREGFYPGFRITGKSLELMSAGATSIESSSVSNLGVDQWVSLYQLNFIQLSQHLIHPTLRLESCSGRVWVEKSVVRAGWNSNGVNTIGMQVSGCQAVDLMDCLVTGAFGKDGMLGSQSTGDGSVALQIEFSRLFAYNTTFLGGSGGSGLPFPTFTTEPTETHRGGNGAPGLTAKTAELYLEKCFVYGGSGGQGSLGSLGVPCGSGGDAAYALELDSAPSWMRGSQLQQGAAGSPGLASSLLCSYGVAPPGPISGPVPDELPGPARRLEFSGFAQEGQSAALVFRGLPGEFAFLLLAPAPAGEFLPAYQGARLVSYPGLTVVPTGFLDANGILQVNLTMPQLPAGLLANSAFLQGAFYGQDQLWLGSGIHLHLLDSSL